MGRGDQPPKGRQWILEADSETGFDDAAVEEALSEAAMILNRVGGVVQIAAHREELPEEIYGQPGVYVTRGLVVQWHSYAPARKAPPPPEPAAEPAEEPVPAAVAG
jgi:hypothetical protein